MLMSGGLTFVVIVLSFGTTFFLGDADLSTAWEVILSLAIATLVVLAVVQAARLLR